MAWSIGAAQTNGWDIGASQSGVPVEVTPELLSVTLTLHAPQVGVGIDETPGLLSVTVSLLVPQVGVGIELFPNTLPIRMELFAPVVTAAVNLDAPLFHQVATLYDVIVGSSVNEQPTTLHTELVLYDAEVGVAINLTARVISVEVMLYDPTVGVVIDVAPAMLHEVLNLKTPDITAVVPVDVDAPLLQYGLALYEPQVGVGSIEIVIPFVLHYYIHLPPVLVVAGQVIRTQKKRVNDALRERVDVGLFLPARVDSNTGQLIAASDDQAVRPTVILITETTALMGLPRRNRQFDRDEKHNWTWEVLLQFSETVTVEPFECDILESPINLAADVDNDLGSVRLRFRDVRYEHPPQQNSSSGSRVTMTFEADLSPV